jgi:glycosyltransferase 2 family protein
VLKRLLLLVGLFALGLLVWQIGPGNIYAATSQLGPLALFMILLPSVCMYAIDAYGWKLALRPAAFTVSFWRLWAIRTAGEVVNMTTPTAYSGGEPLKAYLLRKYSVPIVEGLASVVIAKTTMTIAEVLFILVGLAFGFWVLGVDGPSAQVIVGGVISVGMLLFGTAGFVFMQRRGIFTWILETMRKFGLRIAYLEAREPQLRSIDLSILNFYNHHQGLFCASTGLFFLGWMAEAVEVFVIIYYLGGPASLPSAIAIGALSVFIKGSTFFIPGSLGAQDAGNVLLLKVFGYSDVTGITFALLRRFRELVWIGVGLICLALPGKGEARQE